LRIAPSCIPDARVHVEPSLQSPELCDRQSAAIAAIAAIAAPYAKPIRRSNPGLTIAGAEPVKTSSKDIDEAWAIDLVPSAAQKMRSLLP